MKTKNTRDLLQKNVQKVMVGCEFPTDLLWMAMLVNGHVLLEDVPGTGKTTSILFLLIALLLNDKDNMRIYLIAPGGKAAGRMCVLLQDVRRGNDRCHRGSHSGKISGAGRTGAGLYPQSGCPAAV